VRFVDVAGYFLPRTTTPRPQANHTLTWQSFGRENGVHPRLRRAGRQFKRKIVPSSGAYGGNLAGAGIDAGHIEEGITAPGPDLRIGIECRDHSGRGSTLRPYMRMVGREGGSVSAGLDGAPTRVSSGTKGGGRPMSIKVTRSPVASILRPRLRFRLWSLQNDPSPSCSPPTFTATLSEALGGCLTPLSVPVIMVLW